MSEQVDFYLLAASEPRARSLFACRLAQKASRQGIPVYIKTTDDEHSQALDSLLWTWSQNSFVPHAVYRGDTLDQTRYPVQIGCIDHAQCNDGLLISLCEQIGEEVSSYKRVAEIILNDDQQKASGRQRFKAYRQLGLTPNTHNIEA